MGAQPAFGLASELLGGRVVEIDAHPAEPADGGAVTRVNPHGIPAAAELQLVLWCIVLFSLSRWPRTDQTIPESP